MLLEEPEHAKGAEFLDTCEIKKKNGSKYLQMELTKLFFKN